MTDIVDQELLEAEKIYFDFFDTTPKYQDRIKTLVLKKERRLIIDINDLRNKNQKRVENLMQNSFIEIFACQNALKRCIANINPEFQNFYDDFFVGFEGSFGSRQLNPRTLSSVFLENMICVEGIATKVSVVRSKLVRSVHYCPATNKSLERRYTDMTSADPFPSTGAYPTKDEDGNILETEFGLSAYKDSQIITIQEMPENAPAGQLPISIEVILENDLVDRCKAGDRIFVTGQFRNIPGKKGGSTSATFKFILIANNVFPITHKLNLMFENSDLVMIRKMAKQQNIIELLTRSIAPSICGHEFTKRAVLCQLLGGVERNLANGSRIRGDINLLLIGDPSVAKSQLLRFVLQCAQDRAIATTGRGSTGVGLTAAVVSDKETGERGLEAGAMVLADRGIVCIDEFDKMSDIDRTAIHEVMEQGSVTIAKAGIHARLNARCSVLAAANPVYGNYDKYKTPMENIGLQDSLLSRFDLLFIMLDECDEEIDSIISTFIGQRHLFRNPGEEDGYALPLQNINRVDYVSSRGDEDGEADTPKSSGIFEESNKLHIGADKKEKYFTKDFLKKYIHMARQLSPVLSKEACTILQEKYCDFRSQANEMVNAGSSVNRYRTQPITARTMETLIRLATAHAKARMKKVVTARDAEDAADLVSFVMFKEVLKKTHKRSKPHKESDSDSDENSSNDNKENDRPIKKSRTDSDILNDAEMIELTKALSNTFIEIHDSSMPLKELCDRVQQGTTFNLSQIKTCLQKLHDDNKIMLTEDEVFML